MEDKCRVVERESNYLPGPEPIRVQTRIHSSNIRPIGWFAEVVSVACCHTTGECCRQETLLRRGQTETRNGQRGPAQSRNIPVNGVDVNA